EGPIDLAASLLSSDAGADCLDQSSSGVEALEHPEPAFFVLGSKSYGRNSTFLLDIGFDQIAEVFGAIDRP
ncbi:MAG: flavoprotein, partial [Bradymonadaceae bacterium]